MGKWFSGKLPDDAADTLGVKIFADIAPSHIISKMNAFFAFWAEIQKWRQNDFWEKFPDDSESTLGVKNFVKIALTCTISEINTFLRYTQKFKMATKNGHSINSLGGGQKFRQNHFISHHFLDKCTFAFYTEIEDGHQKWQENNFWEKSPDDSASTLRAKNFAKIALSHTTSKINAFFHKKLQEHDFWEKSPEGSASILGVKNFSKGALSCTIS